MATGIQCERARKYPISGELVAYLANDLCHLMAVIWRCDAATPYLQDHCYAASRQTGEHRLSVAIELNGALLRCFLQRVPYHSASLMMRYLDRIRCVFAAIVRPCQITGEHILWAL